jgi:hypothetical protein
MSIKGNEKAKTQRTVDDVSRGNFDERDIDHLFMSLRAHCGHHLIFREVSDFVAHTDIRDKGVTIQSLEAFYLSFKYFSEYVSPKKALDIGGPFPAYVIKLMKYQIDKCKEADLRQKFDVTRNRLKSRIDKLFRIDKKDNTACLSKRLTEPNYNAIKHILGFIGSHPAYTEEEIISELIAVLNQNKLAFDEKDILSQGDRIMLCILSLIHNSEYDFKGHKKGYCNISCDKQEIPYDVSYLDEKGDPVEVKQSYGNLQINGYVVVVNKGKEVTVCYPVITTNLEVENWCSESLFSVEPSNGGIHFRKVNFEGPIGVSEDFQLVSTNA